MSGGRDRRSATAAFDQLSVDYRPLFFGGFVVFDTSVFIERTDSAPFKFLARSFKLSCNDSLLRKDSLIFRSENPRAIDLALPETATQRNTLDLCPAQRYA